jgi:Leucine-rich repeat (LRR) protein
MVSMFDQHTPLIPRIICEQFPNIQILSTFSCGIKELFPNSIANCKNLAFIGIFADLVRTIHDGFLDNQHALQMALFFENMIEAIPAGLFRNTPNVFEIDFMGNRISQLPAGVFSSLHQLRSLNIRNNDITTINSNAFSATMRDFETLLAERNQIKAIDRRWFENAVNLESVWMFDNICINTAIFDVRTNRQGAVDRLQNCFDNFGVYDPPGNDDGSYIRCNYEDSTVIAPDFSTTCALEIYNPNGRDDFETIEGECFEVFWI